MFNLNLNLYLLSYSTIFKTIESIYLSDIGHYSLIILTILLFICIFQMFFKKDDLKQHKKFIIKYNQKNDFIVLRNILPSFIFLIISISFLSLIYSYIITDLSFLNIINNSHSDLPLVYKICAVWGNHEGSLFLWVWILVFAIFVYSLQAYRFEFINYYNMTERTLYIILIFFLLFLLITSNPFLKTIFFFENGAELNPVLQDLILAIHPPLIYFGYIFYSVPFVIALVMLNPKWPNQIDLINDQIKSHILFIFNRNLFYSRDKILSVHKTNSTYDILIKNINLRHTFFKIMHTWIIISWCFLTFGIFLGSWWAYFELGWGGWWFWDPVENSSLMPWLLGTILLHTFKISYSSQKISLNIYLILLTYIFSLIATFIVRSGLLESVHSFAQASNRSLFLLIFVFTIIFYITYCIFIRRQIEYKNKFVFIFLSHDGLLYINCLLLIFILFIVCTGTFYPTIHQYVFNEGITIGTDFYHNFINPLILPILLLLLLSLILTTSLVNQYYLIMGLVYFITILMVSLKQYEFDWSLTLISTIFGLLMIYFVKMIFILYLNQKANISLYIAHIGFLLFAGSGILYVKFKEEFVAILRIGQKIRASIFKFTFSNFNIKYSSNYNASEGTFTLEADLFNAYPEKRYYFFQDFYVTKPYVLSGLFEDLYVIIGDGNYLHGWDIKLYINPMMTFIWIGGGCMILGGLLALYRHFKRFNKNTKHIYLYKNFE